MRLFQHKVKTGTTEKTLAALISRASTRVHVEGFPSNKTGILGLYEFRRDRIFLFDVGEVPIPPACIALEEAGHSLQRDEYLRNEQYFTSIKKRLAVLPTQVALILDWLEDARIFRLLKKDYPGAAADLDYVWEVREPTVCNYGFDIAVLPDSYRIVHKVYSKLIEIVDRYRSGGTIPATFEEVLKEVSKWLENLLLASDPTWQPLLVSGMEGNQRGQVDESKLTMVRLDTRPSNTVTIVLDYPYDAGGPNSNYSWPIITQDVLSTEGE